jgi:hypothetical protein
MRDVFLILPLLLLSACALTPTAPYYNEKNYVPPAAAPRLSFEEAKTVCRSRTLEHHWMGDTQDLNIPRYTSCMASEGYAFNGGSAK